VLPELIVKLVIPPAGIASTVKVPDPEMVNDVITLDPTADRAVSELIVL
jgi:hypothetical protein